MDNTLQTPMINQGPFISLISDEELKRGASWGSFRVAMMKVGVMNIDHKISMAR